MIDYLKVFRGGDYPLSAKITIKQPTLDEICAYGEQRYWGLVRAICSTPADRKVEIWDSQHIFWDKVDEYELFLSLFKTFSETDMSILFGDLDFTSFKPSMNGLQEIAMKNKDNVVIDRATHKFLTDYIRRLHKLQKNVDTGFDDYTKEIMIEDDRDEMAMRMRKPFESLLLPLISSLTNCPEFKYRWDDVWELPIGVFMDSVERVQKHKNYSFVMHGIYNGCVDLKKLNKKELNWMAEMK